jgi:hypothetical protein
MLDTKRDLRLLDWALSSCSRLLTNDASSADIQLSRIHKISLEKVFTISDLVKTARTESLADFLGHTCRLRERHQCIGQIFTFALKDLHEKEPLSTGICKNIPW